MAALLRRWPLAVGVLAVALTVLYLTTARVYIEGSLAESWLMLKPLPSLENSMGGGEEGAWARAHPGQQPPWWRSEDAVRLLWGGDWEDPVAWTLFYDLGILLTPALWLSLAVVGVVRLGRGLIATKTVRARS